MAKKQKARPVEKFGTQDTVVNEYSNLLFDKPKDPSFWDKNSLFDKNCLENWITVWQNLGIDQYLTPCTRIKSKWVHDVSIKIDTVNQLVEQGIMYLSYLWRMDKFLIKQEIK